MGEAGSEGGRRGPVGHTHFHSLVHHPKERGGGREGMSVKRNSLEDSVSFQKCKFLPLSGQVGETTNWLCVFLRAVVAAIFSACSHNR